MADTVHDINYVDPIKAFEALAKIIRDKEWIEIALKSLKKRSKENKEETG